MLTPSIREDLQLFEGTPLEDGSPTWLLFDTLTNKYFTIGLNAFRLLNYWNADVDTKSFIKNVEQKGVNLKEEELVVLHNWRGSRVPPQLWREGSVQLPPGPAGSCA